MVTIRFAREEDIDLIMCFIDEHWKKNHIMSKDKKLFCWQHLEGHTLNYVVGIDDETKTLYGCLGFIYMNRSNNPDIVSMMIKTIKNEREMLGYEMTTFLEQSVNCRYHEGVGINPKTIGRLVIARGGTILCLNQYYRLNQDMDYQIALIRNKIVPAVSGEGKLFAITSKDKFASIFSDEYLSTKVFYKDIRYYIHKYFEHLYYTYRVLGILNGACCKAVMIGREICVENHKIFRVVDFIGEDNELASIGPAFDEWMKERQYEYVDFREYGISDEIMTKMGFVKREKDDVNIIPNYFEPFEQRNVDIYISSQWASNYHAYAGDGDQDRPNQIPATKLIDINYDKKGTLNLPTEQGKLYRIHCPAGMEYSGELAQKGYYLADRMINVSVKLQHRAETFLPKVRYEIRQEDNIESLYDMACRNFDVDSRFQVSKNSEVAHSLITNTLNQADVVYTCLIKQEVAGFLAIRDDKEQKEIEVILACVDEKFRIAGGAVSLYYAVAHKYADLSYRKMSGIISSRNTPVMNLYASMGAVFSQPEDIYLKIPE